MARKESLAIAQAFIAGRSKRMARTTTDGSAIFLHFNRIAWRDETGAIYATLAGWGTVTTRDRLNTLALELGLGKPFHQSKHEQRFNGSPIGTREIIRLV